ncbi:MAG: proline--tRNA ligase [Gammaproteobacteria bacterium]|nr:proline--tRNA ligase [Gammaproteobacteria bacterium]
MRASPWLISTLKESPHEAETASHQLMLRAGFIRPLASGLYTWLPLGLKVLRHIEQVVREELNKISALELLMPAVQPAELWQESTRWETFGGQLLRITDNNDREYCFGPTHEEVITDLMRQELQSYKQLPLTVYQIQTKFRDEIRPRFGVMRAREFLMKDAYSFHLDATCLENTYQIIHEAYCHIFDRLGFKYRPVEADSGAIGGAVSHEFQVLADSGEDCIAYSDTSEYAANVEQATSLAPEPADNPTTKPLEYVKTPDAKTITDLTKCLHVEANQTVKTLLVEGVDTSLVALVIRGDDTLNTTRAAKHPLVQSPLVLADDTRILQTLNAPLGFVGPIGLDIPVIVDHHALAMNEFVCGANQKDMHCINASWTRDVKTYEAFDLREVKAGDKSPDGQGHLKLCRGIEVGHIFQLGSKYAELMKATVLNAEGKAQTLLMGCYGLGISRMVAAAIEQHHDERGICLPEAMAPFKIGIIPINMHRSERVKEAAEALYQSLLDQGFDVLLDDRKERPGVLFADHDLIGIPHRLVIGERGLDAGMIEYKARCDTEAKQIPIGEVQALFATS